MTHVIVLGGGVAGLTAAHELVERGFQVSVYESLSQLGGKARSWPMPSTGLPVEHGFRFIGGFYSHLPHTMSRIPSPFGSFVSDHLQQVSRGGWGRFGKPLVLNNMRFPTSLADLLLVFDTTVGNPFGIPQNELAFIVERIWQMATSCEQRRFSEYELKSWWSYIEADAKSPQYQSLFGMVTHSFVAADPKRVSARTMGAMAVQSLLGTMTPGKEFQRVLDAPTSEAWLEPWVAHLKTLGVSFFLNSEVESISVAGGTISGVKLRGQSTPVTGDEYLCALPVEVTAALLDANLLAADPSLVSLKALATHVSWMTGIQFFLEKKLDLIPGHILYLDSPWALTLVSQAQFWPNTNLPAIGGKGMKTCISAIASDWFSPGRFVGKPASQCTKAEIVDEIWKELQGLQDPNGASYLAGVSYQHVHLDPAITFDPVSGVVNANRERLLVNDADTWRLRPNAWTAIPNFWLAGDYLKTNSDVACMESANEGARRAVNAILSKHGKGSLCGIWKLPEPALVGPAVLWDELRFELGLPWSLTPFTI